MNIKKHDSFRPSANNPLSNALKHGQWYHAVSLQYLYWFANSRLSGCSHQASLVLINIKMVGGRMFQMYCKCIAEDSMQCKYGWSKKTGLQLLFYNITISIKFSSIRMDLYFAFNNRHCHEAAWQKIWIWFSINEQTKHPEMTWRKKTLKRIVKLHRHYIYTVLLHSSS